VVEDAFGVSKLREVAVPAQAECARRELTEHRVIRSKHYLGSIVNARGPRKNVDRQGPPSADRFHRIIMAECGHFLGELNGATEFRMHAPCEVPDL
jgi:hypothetical protein